jgi:hypothetical protein
LRAALKKLQRLDGRVTVKTRTQHGQPPLNPKIQSSTPVFHVHPSKNLTTIKTKKRQPFSRMPRSVVEWWRERNTASGAELGYADC